MGRHSHLIIAAVVASATAASLSLGGPASAASHRWEVQIGNRAVAVTAAYPSVQVPSDTNLLAVSLPARFDWAPADPAAPAPAVTWSLMKDGAVVGAPDAPDSGTLAGFGATGSIDFSTLPTDPPVGSGYTLHVYSVWDAAAPLDAGDLLDLSTPIVVTSAVDGSDVPINLAFANATSETRTYTVALDSPVAGGDTLHLSTSTAVAPWSWATGPDVDNTWATPAQVYGAIGAGNVDPMAGSEELDGPFAITTPTPTQLVVPVPNTVYAGSDAIALVVSSRDEPVSGPVVTVRVNLRTGFSAGVSGLVATTRPVLSGTARFGRTLSVTSGAWEPASAGGWATGTTLVTYAWYRGSAPILGATSTVYAPVAGDVGKVISVRVTGHIAGYAATTVAVSGVTVAPALAPRATTRPTITGTVSVGRRVAARVGTWSPAPTGYAYQWYSDGRAIAGATRSSLVIPSSLRGHALSVRVVAARAGHTSGIAFSLARRVS